MGWFDDIIISKTITIHSVIFVNFQVLAFLESPHCRVWEMPGHRKILLLNQDPTSLQTSLSHTPISLCNYFPFTTTTTLLHIPPSIYFLSQWQLDICCYYRDRARFVLPNGLRLWHQRKRPRLCVKSPRWYLAAEPKCAIS